MPKKGTRYELGMPNPRTPEDNIKLNGLIYRGLLGGKTHLSRSMQVGAFIVGLMFFLPLLFTLLSFIGTPDPINLLNLVFNVVLAIPGMFIIYQTFKKQAYLS